MNPLLDTCALLALVKDARSLPKDASQAIRRADEISVSAISAWEIAIKCSSGKLRLDLAPLEWFERACARYRLAVVDLDARIACLAASLPHIHRDPFDRAIVATARIRDLTIITPDANIAAYPDVRAVW